jgi:hypothetical protein
MRVSAVSKARAFKTIDVGQVQIDAQVGRVILRVNDQTRAAKLAPAEAGRVADALRKAARYARRGDTDLDP